MEPAGSTWQLGSVARHLVSHLFSPVLNRIAKSFGEEIFREYQPHRQPDHKAHNEFAHHRSAATGAPIRAARASPCPIIGPRQKGKIMVDWRRRAKKKDTKLAIPGPCVYCSGTILEPKRLQTAGLAQR